MNHNIRNLNAKLKVAALSLDISSTHNWIRLGIIEIPLKGQSFTWSNMQSDPLLLPGFTEVVSNAWNKGIRIVSSAARIIHSQELERIKISVSSGKEFEINHQNSDRQASKTQE
ncbi:hypothetical protein ACJX0J_025257 [Zea mays]